jgi:protein-L-isoaspartate(D-aspartate) O-methyltransferase
MQRQGGEEVMMNPQNAHGPDFVPGVPPDDALRAALVAQLEQQGRLTHSPVAAAMRAVPRHLFLPEVSPERAYADEAVVTKWSADHVALSSASQPAMIAIMLEQLAVEPGMRVLEIGAGTGYNAALLAYLTGPTGHVTTIDIDQDIVEAARAHLAAAGLDADRVTVLCGDGALGDPAHAPYDRIILTVGAWDVAPAWFTQLVDGGRLVLPLALHTLQLSAALDRHGASMRSASLRACGFIRLRGAFAGPEQLVSLEDTHGLRLLAEPPIPPAGQIAALLAEPPRFYSLDQPRADGLRFALAFMVPHVVTALTTAPHPTLGQGALGIITPEGDSASFITWDAVGARLIPLCVEYGAATAGLALEGVIARWQSLGRPSLDAWQMFLHPRADDRAQRADGHSFWLTKQHWLVEMRVQPPQ